MLEGDGDIRWTNIGWGCGVSAMYAGATNKPKARKRHSSETCLSIVCDTTSKSSWSLQIFANRLLPPFSVPRWCFPASVLMYSSARSIPRMLWNDLLRPEKGLTYHVEYERRASYLSTANQCNIGGSGSCIICFWADNKTQQQHGLFLQFP